MEIRPGFSDSNDIIVANNNSSCYSPTTTDNISSLRLLSDNLESIFDSSDYYPDAELELSNGKKVAVHRCILSGRSMFFKTLFKEGNNKLVLKELVKDHEIGYDALICVIGYLYSGVVKECPKGVCVCADEECLHVGCRPVVDFLVEVFYASFCFQISELVDRYQINLLEILDQASVDDVLIILCVANTCGKSSECLLAKCIDIVVKSDVDIVTLEKALPHHIVKQITDTRKELGLDKTPSTTFPDKHVKRIHRALDSDDVELVRMLLKEGHTNLDDANALHYAVAYCDAKTTTELLDLGLADVNRRNLRGYSVLHVAAMRKDPKIIVSLLTKGASPSDLTMDGRKALQISKRLTRALDYGKQMEEGKASPKDRLCIEVLEQAERRDPLLGEASVSLAMAGDDLRMKLLYLENRVGLAKILFPMEAKVAMDIAQVDGTSEFTLASIRPNNLVDAQRTTVDLNEAPFKLQEVHLNRLRALSKTVELGKRFFPRCSAVLNKIMDAEDITQLAYLGNDTPEERQLKRQRYLELQDVLSKAFNEDKEEFDKSVSALSSSSSSTKSKVTARPNGKL
ncbi:hypothetical protein ACFE04_013838 [Oxalis oulophora]